MKSIDRTTKTHARGRRTAGRAQNDAVEDPYQRRGKPSGPATCPDCGAVFHEGRWQWSAAPAGAASERCPACSRIRDGAPAGTVNLTGPFVLEHRHEIRTLARRQEEAEKREHALNRIISIRDLPDGIEITTTDIHLPRRIGEAVRRAYKGDLDLRYGQDEHSLHVLWSRGGAPEA